MKGHVGKILRANLTNKDVKTIETAQYEDWVGGNGIATAIWFDLVENKAISGFDPQNTLVIMTGLFAGTLIPAANRAEMVGIQVQSYPYEWFTRSNVGGRFAAMLKYAGYDGIVLEGAADKPVWINIIDGEVDLKDATDLWGLDTYETQRAIIRAVSGKMKDAVTMQKAAVLTIGSAGENRSRIAAIIHDSACAFGQGGFGGIWGAKKLKAISVLGTKSVEVADPKAMVEARLWAEKNYAPDFDHPKVNQWQEFITSHFGGHPNRVWTPYDVHNRRPSGCTGCHLNCRQKTASNLGNEAICVEALLYQNYDLDKHGHVTEASGKASDLIEKLGINAFELYVGIGYLKALYDKGVLGSGKEVDTDLPFDKIGEAEFIEELLHRIAYRVEIGDDIAEGFPRASERWGRLEEDFRTGIHPAMFWGYPVHYDTRSEVYWGYASIVSARDINCHDFNVPAYWMPTLDIQYGKAPLVSAAEVAEIIKEKCAPFNDPLMIDFSEKNIYSEHMAKTVAWLMRYTFFWKQSCGLCDIAFADFVNPYGPNNKGLTPEGEVRFFKAATGKDLSFTDSLETGRKIWNLNRVIYVLQGRHRDMEKFPEYVYTVDTKGSSYVPGKPPACYMPVLENGKWKYANVVPRHLDRNKVEEWKTKYYELEGWDPKTGWPTRKTLEELGLTKAADELARQGKL